MGRNVHRSQNRIESYHQLRSAIAQVSGKKELTGRIDIEIEVSNQCARLIANAITCYNSAILSHLPMKCESSDNAKAVALITRMSQAAWRHILSWALHIQWALHIPERRKDDRPGSALGRAGFGVTKFPGVPA